MQNKNDKFLTILELRRPDIEKKTPTKSATSIVASVFFVSTLGFLKQLLNRLGSPEKTTVGSSLPHAACCVGQPLQENVAHPRVAERLQRLTYLCCVRVALVEDGPRDVVDEQQASVLRT